MMDFTEPDSVPGAVDLSSFTFDPDEAFFETGTTWDSVMGYDLQNLDKYDPTGVDLGSGLRSWEDRVSLDEDTSNPACGHSYALRPPRSTDALLDSTWLDQDASGDYDPQRESHLTNPRKRKRFFQARCLGDEEEAARRNAKKEAKERLQQECQSRGHIGCEGVVSLKVRSEDIRQLLSQMIDHWPQDACKLRETGAALGSLSISSIIRDRTRQRRKLSLIHI